MTVLDQRSKIDKKKKKKKTEDAGGGLNDVPMEILSLSLAER